MSHNSSIITIFTTNWSFDLRLQLLRVSAQVFSTAASTWGGAAEIPPFFLDYLIRGLFLDGRRLVLGGVEASLRGERVVTVVLDQRVVRQYHVALEAIAV